MVRFALFLHASDREGRAQLFSQLFREAETAEEVGFDACLVAEHHQSPDGHYPAPLTIAAAIGARTKRIKVGTSVLLLPLYHPVHVAEEGAMVDLITGGRLILGMGLGYSTRDFGPFGSSLAERARRMNEGVEIIDKVWREDNVHYEGKHYRLDGVSVHPKPLQQPRPPIWLGGFVEPAIKRAGRLGDAWIGDPFRDVEELREPVQMYREAAAAAGRQPVVALRRDCWVAADRETAIREYGPAIESFERFMSELETKDTFHNENIAGQDAAKKVVSNRLVLGGPEDCIQTIEQYRKELGIEWFTLRFRQPDGPEHEKVVKAIRLFGEQVISHFRR